MMSSHVVVSAVVPLPGGCWPVNRMYPQRKAPPQHFFCLLPSMLPSFLLPLPLRLFPSASTFPFGLLFWCFQIQEHVLVSAVNPDVHLCFLGLRGSPTFTSCPICLFLLCLISPLYPSRPRVTCLHDRRTCRMESWLSLALQAQLGKC